MDFPLWTLAWVSQILKKTERNDPQPPCTSPWPSAPQLGHNGVFLEQDTAVNACPGGQRHSIRSAAPRLPLPSRLQPEEEFGL